MTLIEITLVCALLGVVVAAVLGILNSAQTNLERQISRADSNDQVRLAIKSIDREARSGDVLYDPANESYSPGDVASGMSLRIYSESNYGSRGNVKVCDQWRITSAGELQERHWTRSDPTGTVTGWRIAATHITNRSDSVAAFTRPGTSMNAINIKLRTNNAATKGGTVEVTSTLTGRNTQFFSTNSPCGPTSPAPVPGADGIPAY